jgi:hypothetical protein
MCMHEPGQKSCGEGRGKGKFYGGGDLYGNFSSDL